jgi:sRNA-binding carbon storage regulator CsrA
MLRLDRRDGQYVILEDRVTGDILGEFKVGCSKGQEIKLFFDMDDDINIVREEVFFKEPQRLHKIAQWRNRE